MPGNKELPADLRKPIRIEELLSETQGRKAAGLDHRGVVTAELRRRVSLLAEHLGMSWPEDEETWLRLVIAICSHWKVPGFQIATTGAGAKKKWPVWRNLELLFDVHSLIATKKRSSEFGACQYIAQHPEKYENRYPRNAATLHRQFLRAKKQLASSEKTDPKSVADSDRQVDFLATRQRMLEKMTALESAARNPRRKMHD
jgi:hypothetical protein